MTIFHVLFFKHEDYPESSSLAFSGGLFNQSHYELVAIVEAEDIENVFRDTNHVDIVWWNNKSVIKYKKSRSCSVGDIIVDVEGKKAWLCDMSRWVELPRTEVEKFILRAKIGVDTLKIPVKKFNFEDEL